MSSTNYLVSNFFSTVQDAPSYLKKNVKIVSYLHGVIQSLLLIAPTVTFRPPPIQRDVNLVFLSNVVIWKNGYLCNSARYRVRPSARKTINLIPITETYKLSGLVIIDVVLSKGQSEFTLDIISVNMEYYETELASTRYSRHAHQDSTEGNIVFGRSRSDYSCIYTPDADQTPWVSASPARLAHCPVDYIRVKTPKDALYPTAYSRFIAYLALPRHAQYYVDHDADGLFEYFNKTKSAASPRVKFSLKEGLVINRCVDVTEHVLDEIRTSMSMEELIKRYTPVIEDSTCNLTLASFALKTVVYPASRDGGGVRYLLDINFSDLALHDLVIRNLRDISAIRREESSFTSGLVGAIRRIVFDNTIVDATNYISDSDELDLASNYPSYTDSEGGQDCDDDGDAPHVTDSDDDDDEGGDDDNGGDDSADSDADSLPDSLPGFTLRLPARLTTTQLQIAQTAQDYVVPLARHFDVAVPPNLAALMEAAAAMISSDSNVQDEPTPLPPPYTPGTELQATTVDFIHDAPPPPYALEDPHPQ